MTSWTQHLLASYRTADGTAVFRGKLASGFWKTLPIPMLMRAKSIRRYKPFKCGTGWVHWGDKGRSRKKESVGSEGGNTQSPVMPFAQAVCD